MKLFLSIAAALVISLLPVKAHAASPQENAFNWILLLDAGKYDESYDAASDFFKSKATKQQWAGIIQPVRDGVGPVEDRKGGSIIKTDRLPNAPFGQYTVITFKTTFAIKGASTETVILKLEDGEWKVAGYFVK